MSLEVIKQLKEEVEAVKAEIVDARGEERIKALESELAELKAAEARKIPSAKGEVSVKGLAEKASNLKLKSILLGKDYRNMEEYKELSATVEKAIKPADIPNWVDEAFSSEILKYMDLELKIAKLFGSYTIPEGVQTLSVPRLDAGATAYLIKPADDAVESALTTGKVSFQPTKIKSLVITADETNQEAVVKTILEVVKQDLAYSLAKAVENALVNGDQDTGSDNINGDPAATDVTRAYPKGLRKFGLVHTVDAGGNAITLDEIKSARKLMGKYGMNPSEIALVVNPTVFYQLLDIPEVLTVDKIGNDKAVILTGQLGSVLGMPIVVTEYIPLNLDANGKVNDSSGNKTAAILSNSKSFRRADRNAVGFESDRNIVNGTNLYTGQVFSDFKMTAVDDNCITSIINIGE